MNSSPILAARRAASRPATIVVAALVVLTAAGCLRQRALNVVEAPAMQPPEPAPLATPSAEVLASTAPQPTPPAPPRLETATFALG